VVEWQRHVMRHVMQMQAADVDLRPDFYKHIVLSGSNLSVCVCVSVCLCARGTWVPLCIRGSLCMRVSVCLCFESAGWLFL
jgi:hypothetical protein